MSTCYIPKNEEIIEDLYVILSRDEDGKEGIVSVITDAGCLPLVFGSKKLIGIMKETAKRISKETQRPLYLMRYVKSEQLEIINETNE